MKNDKLLNIISQIAVISSGEEIEYERYFDKLQQDKFRENYQFVIGKDNPQKLLNEYLQTSADFLSFQTSQDLFPSYWSLFSIIDPSDDSQPVKYLYGTDDEHKSVKASFFLRCFRGEEKEVYLDDETPEVIHQLGKVASLIRHFGQIESATRDLSSLEEEMVYVPSGEIDYHILKWCLKYLNENNIDYENDSFKFFPVERYKELGVDPSMFDALTRYEHKKKYFRDWLVLWGLAERNQGKEYQWTDRGNCLMEALKVKPGNFFDHVKLLMKALRSKKNLMKGSENSFQKEIHFLSRFRSYSKSRRGILRFSHPEFKHKDRYVIYLNVVVLEKLENGLLVNQKDLADHNHELNYRFQKIRQIYKPLMAIEYKRIFIDEIIPRYEEKIRYNSIKSAISQICSRNGSHNIGSHVLSRLVTKQSLEEMLLELKDQNHRNNQYEPMKKLAQNSRQDYDSMEYMAYFYSYLKTRMDFLADIATSAPSLENSKLFFQEVMAGFDKNRILLNRISGIDNFRFRISVKDCRKCTAKDNQLCSCSEINPENDFPISMVNDILGQHAFYVILENIIRNTAKHGDIKKGQVVEFTISVKEDFDHPGYYRLLIHDNCPISGSGLKKLVGSQNARLNASILKEDNTLRNGSWGLIEMDISSAYLRRINVEDVDLFKYDIPLNPAEAMQFRKDPDREQKLILRAVPTGNHLAYELYLPKPQELLVIDTEGLLWKELFQAGAEINTSRLKQLEDRGIMMLHDLSDPLISKWRIQKGVCYAHPLILTDNEAVRSHYSTQRIIKYGDMMETYLAYKIARNLSHMPEVTSIGQLFEKPELLLETAWRYRIVQKMRFHGIDSLDPENTYSRFVGGKIEKNTGTNAFLIMLDDHGSLFTKENYNYINEKVDYYQQFDHLTRDLTVNRIQAVNNTSDESMAEFKPFFKFLEGALTNVLIIDERIQHFFSKNKSAKIKRNYGFFAEKTGVFCPYNRFIDLSAHRLPKNSIEHICQYLEHLGPKLKIRSMDIVVVHIGLIEKMLKSAGKKKGKSDIENFVSELSSAMNELYGYHPFFIITSGRGKPENLPDTIPFIGYSILSQYAIENRFKCLLTEALYSSRPKA